MAIRIRIENPDPSERAALSNNNGIRKLQILGTAARIRGEQAEIRGNRVEADRGASDAREITVRRQVQGRHMQLPPGQGGK